jgi:hypothetical protein
VACSGGANSTGGITSTCTCTGLGNAYAEGAAYNSTYGCPCAANSFQKADLTCAPCTGGGTSEGGFDEPSQCVCNRSGDKYLGTPYNNETGCACSAAYAKPADHPGGVCSGARAAPAAWCTH